MLKIYQMAEMAVRTKGEKLDISHLTMTYMIYSEDQLRIAGNPGKIEKN